MSYAVKEIFLTIQGEGYWSGQRAVFVRFSGCNVWSGREVDRERDAAKGNCARWCDTDFVGLDGSNGGKYTASELAKRVLEVWKLGDNPFVVITGGEPSLQLDVPLVGALKQVGAYVAVETNGSGALPPGLDWVCLSPKPPMRVVQRFYNEVKVVFPTIADPAAYADLAMHRFISPLDQAPLLGLRRVDLAPEAIGQRGPFPVPAYEEALAYVMAHPEWRLSVQQHKIIGVP